MGLHDRLAQHAFLRGKRAKQFEAAASRHANAFWMWAIATGLLWWLVDGLWWVIPAVLAGWSVLYSVSATMIQTRLERIEEAAGAATE